MTQEIQKLSSKDLLTSAATLTGLSIAALSFMATFGSSVSDILGKVSILLAIAVALFVATVILLSINEFIVRPILWKLALTAYSVGWILIGILIVETAIRLGLGRDYLTTQQVGILSLIIILVSGIPLFKIFGRGLLETLRASTEKINRLSQKIVPTARAAPPRDIPDPKLAFLESVISLEKKVRDMAKTQTISGWDSEPVPGLVEKLVGKNVLPSDVMESVDAVWDYRNLVLHGLDVTPENLDAARTIANFEADKLRPVTQKS